MPPTDRVRVGLALLAAGHVTDRVRVRLALLAAKSVLTVGSFNGTVLIVGSFNSTVLTKYNSSYHITASDLGEACVTRDG
jgi:hypothetical protein